jgi:3D-(3,5/4)-trihydroxycyclohexane-1,2-dione acylhydrolase (decyclizing)
MAAPERDVYVMVGDGSYLMLANEIVTSIQEDKKLIIVILDSQGYNSIGGLSRSLGQKGFATRYVFPKNNVLPGDDAGPNVEALPVDLAANARSLGAIVFDCKTCDEFTKALEEAKKTDRTAVVHTHVDRYVGVPGYDSWWDVHVAEVGEMDSVQESRKKWETMRAKERYFLKDE